MSDQEERSTTPNGDTPPDLRAVAERALHVLRHGATDEQEAFVIERLKLALAAQDQRPSPPPPSVDAKAQRAVDLMGAADRRVRSAAGRLADATLGLLASLDQVDVPSGVVADAAIAHARFSIAMDTAGAARCLAGDASDFREVAGLVAEAQELASSLPQTPRVRSLVTHLQDAWVISSYLRQQAADIEAEEGSRE